jgi:hypothetical protein
MKDHVGKRCWQARGFVHIGFGNVISQKMDDSGWLLVEVRWDTGQTSWEKIVNVSFKEIQMHTS